MKISSKATLPTKPSAVSLPDLLKFAAAGADDHDCYSTSTASDDDDDEDDMSLSEYSDASDWDDPCLHEYEQRANAFSAVGTTPAFAAMVFQSRSGPTQPIQPQQQLTFGNTGKQKNDSSDRSIHSQGRLESRASIGKNFSFAMRRSNSDVVIQTTDYNSKPKEHTKEEDPNVRKPQDVFKSILTEQGYADKVFPAKSLEGFFLEMGPTNISAYSNSIATAAREGDLDTFKAHRRTGKTLQCCNKFHESIVHTICRRGHGHLLQYLLDKTDVSIVLADDYGRTPLHDAAWTDSPNFELVTLLLKTCPDLLLISDQRGFTPLAYVGRQRWEDWCKFLENNKELLAPKVLL